MTRTSEIRVELWGVAIGVRSDDPGVAQRIEAHLPAPARAPGSGPVDVVVSVRTRPDATGPGYDVEVDGRLVARRRDPEWAARVAAARARHLAALRTRRRVVVHAGVVAAGGRALVLPGRTGAGKSTLVAALVRAGAGYASDEYAVLDGGGRVHPFPKPISLRAADGTAPELVDAAALGGSPVTDPLPIGLVVATAYRTGARFAPHPMSRADAVLALFDNAVAAVPRFQAVRRSIVAAVPPDVVAVRGARGDADEAAVVLLELMAASTRHAPEPRA